MFCRCQHLFKKQKKKQELQHAFGVCSKVGRKGAGFMGEAGSAAGNQDVL